MRTRFPALFLALGMPLLAQTDAPPHSADTPWDLALRFDYSDAVSEFARRHAASPDDPRVAIGYASTLLAKQPRTEANILASHALLERTLATTPANAELRPIILYQLARIEHDHLSPARTDAARARYDTLRKEHAAHRLASFAVLNLAMIEVDRRDKKSPRPTIARIEALLPDVSDSGARREMHALLAMLHWRELGDAHASIRHQQAAMEIGYTRQARTADAHLSIANLAIELHDPVLARQHLQAFLKLVPRDTRAGTARNLLASLDAPSPRS